MGEASRGPGPVQVAQLTSAHSRDDVRVFLKQCRTLAGMGYAVTLVVADGNGPAMVDGVRIIDVGRRSGGRVGRALVSAGRVFRAARDLRAHIYHIHDPELLPWAVLLRWGGATVVYDAHEHLPEDILSKHYLPGPLAKPLSVVAGSCELMAAKYMSGVVAATPHILERFEAVGRMTEGIYNFPVVNELARSTEWVDRKRWACYVGGVSINRGLREIARAAEICRTRIVVAGALWDGLELQAASQLPGWDCVRYRGKISREQVAGLMGSSRVGIVTFLPTESHINSLPNKLFEYMSAGIPVVASDFPLWREIVVATGSGLCVDPRDPHAIAAAIDELAENDSLGAACGRNGIRAVTEEFNWMAQARKLSDLYRRIRSRGRNEGATVPLMDG